MKYYKNQVVLVQVPECAKPMLVALRNSVLRAGAHPVAQYLPDKISREFYELANEEQINFFPEKFMRGKAEQIDHTISIIAEVNKKELQGIDPKKIMDRSKSMKPYREWLDDKENEGRYSWVIAMYGTEEMAKEVNMSIEEYWDQIIKACYLDENDPIKKWKEIQVENNYFVEKLNSMRIEKVHVEAENTDLWVRIGEKRRWQGCSGRNIPSFEIFTSPDWREVNGHIKFTEPLYRYGNLIKDIFLRFEKGIVVEFSASEGEDILREMIKAENANKIGEFSMTDGRMSRITKYMGETLYDENVGGKEGNMHLALGNAYQDCYEGDPAKVSKEEWKEWGYNESVVHTDIVATSSRKITAYTFDKKEVVIYEKGKFLI